MLLKDFVGNIAVAATILQFLSGILVCKEYVHKNTTGDASPLPFLTGVLSGFLWLLYGIAKEDEKIILVNCVGITLMVLYTIVFYMYTLRRPALVKQCFVLIVMIGGVSWWNMMKIEDNTNVNLVIKYLGILASIVTLLTIASPMSKLVHVLKVKNTECLPFPIIFMSSVVSSLWCLYGFLINDMVLVVVNFCGTLIAMAQLLLFVIYPRSPYLPLKVKGTLVS